MNARDIANGWAAHGPYTTKRRPGLIRAVLIALACFAAGYIARGMP